MNRRKNFENRGKAASLLLLLPAFILTALIPLGAQAQIPAQFDSNSDGSDGALIPADAAQIGMNEDFIIDMADHPDGIYNYTSVNIPPDRTVKFLPNANNTPVTWLVQTDCTIGGIVNVNGLAFTGQVPGRGGPGGFAGGYGGDNAGPNFDGGAGQGPGGGAAGVAGATTGGEADFASTYGNKFLLPLIGGSGGGGNRGNLSGFGSGGRGGGGAILIAVTDTLTVNGAIRANGSSNNSVGSLNGSGGGVRLVSTNFAGTGSVQAKSRIINGRIRIETYDHLSWTGSFSPSPGAFDFPGILLLPSTAIPVLTIASIAGLAVPGTPGGDVLVPDVTVPAQTINPIDVVVNCANVPPASTITLVVKPKFEAASTLTSGNTGTLLSSTATFTFDLMPGDGILESQATVSVTPAKSASNKTSLSAGEGASRYRTAGLAPNGESFTSIELTAVAGGPSKVVFVTESGARYPLPPGVKL